MFIDDGVRVWALGQGSNFQLVRGPQKLSFKAFSSRRSSLTQTFVESCVDFEVAHLSICTHGSEIATPEIPTLIVSETFLKCFCDITRCIIYSLQSCI